MLELIPAAEYGMGILALILMVWLVQFVIRQLMNVIMANTSVLKELSTLIKVQSGITRHVLDKIENLEVTISRCDKNGD